MQADSGTVVCKRVGCCRRAGEAGRGWNTGYDQDFGLYFQCNEKLLKSFGLGRDMDRFMFLRMILGHCGYKSSWSLIKRLLNSSK